MNAQMSVFTPLQMSKTSKVLDVIAVIEKSYITLLRQEVTIINHDELKRKHSALSKCIYKVLSK